MSFQIVPRKPRVQYPGAIYHIMSRGDRREDIFLDDVDRQDFLKTLAEACQKTGFQVHAYCLMRNHFHLVVQTPDANLVAGMAWLLSAYTIGLNHRHQLFGHVFSGRYKALLVEGKGNGYLKSVCDYVHLNPVRAGLLKSEDRLRAYPWTSLVWYGAAREHRPIWLRVDRLLGEHGIGEDTAVGREEFERRMEGRRAAEEEEEAWWRRSAGAGAWGARNSSARCWSEWRAAWASTMRASCAGNRPRAEPKGSWRRNCGGWVGRSRIWSASPRVRRASWFWPRG